MFHWLSAQNFCLPNGEIQIPCWWLILALLLNFYNKILFCGNSSERPVFCIRKFYSFNELQNFKIILAPAFLSLLFSMYPRNLQVITHHGRHEALGRHVFSLCFKVKGLINSIFNLFGCSWERLFKGNPRYYEESFLLIFFPHGLIEFVIFMQLLQFSHLFLIEIGFPKLIQKHVNWLKCYYYHLKDARLYRRKKSIEQSLA
jgi:hypothetical protein